MKHEHGLIKIAVWHPYFAEMEKILLWSCSVFSFPPRSLPRVFLRDNYLHCRAAPNFPNRNFAFRAKLYSLRVHLHMKSAKCLHI